MADGARGPEATRGRAAGAVVWSSAVAAAAVVVLVVLLARPGNGADPAPPDPGRVLPVRLDQGGVSLDRCAVALDSTGLADRYPDRADWRPLAVLATGDVFVTLLDGAVPFACVTDPRTVTVSDPAAAAPLGTAQLLLSTPAGVLAAVAPVHGAVAVTPVDGGPPGGPPTRYFLRMTGTPVSDASRLTATVDGPTGPRLLGRPDRLAPPALHLVDRPWQPSTRPTGTVDVLDRCRAAAPDAGAAPRPWHLAQLLPHGSPGQGTSLLVAVSTGTVGGCSVGPDRVTPLRVWRVGTIGDGARPFVWLPRPGQPLPDIATDVAAGPVAPAVTRMEISADGGPHWDASLAGGTFATRIPDGVTRDPRELTVRVHDARNRVVYQGPAAD